MLVSSHWSFAAIGLILFVSLAQSASNANPETVYSCNATSTSWGCPREEWRLKTVTRNGQKVQVPNRLRCDAKPKPIMSWATKTVRSESYALFAGPQDNPQTSYVPGSIVDVTIKVMKYDAKYRGLMMYAEDENQNHVGEWKLPDVFPAFFHIPWSANHSCRHTVMHTSAVLKPLRSTFTFIAPPKGTGKIWFRALVKSGDANTGDFWWPNIDEDFSMTESSDPAPTNNGWFQSELGQSCTQRCAEEGLLCDRVSMERVNSISRINEELKSSGFICRKPYLSGCSEIGTSQSEDGFCYFDDTRCATQNRLNERVTCDSNSTDPDDGLRFCKCLTTTLAPIAPEETLVPPTPGPTPFVLPPLPIPPTQAPASRASSSLLLVCLSLLISTLFARGRSNGAAPLFLVLFLIALTSFPVSIRGHNWMFSLSRRTYASTETPCPPKIQDMPHAQVGPNQYFELEWACGHDEWSYFVVVHEKYEDKLKLHTKKLMLKYFEEAPAGAVSSIPIYHRQFRERTDFQTNEYTKYYGPEIKSDDAAFIPRPEAFGGWRDDARLLPYKDQYHLNNYAEYENPNMTWIESILRAEHLVNRPSDADIAKIKIPGRAGPGRYIVHWIWRGYRDCTDVDYVDHQVDQIYGVKEDSPSFTRVDHCYFPKYSRAYGCSRIYDDFAYCARRCPPSSVGCAGVAVMPLTVPHNSYFQEAGLVDPSCYKYFNFSALTEPVDQVYICFAVSGRIPSDTFGVNEIVYEDDPAYHATCYMKNSGRTFPGYVPPTEKKVSWKHGEKCIDCHSANLNRNLSRVPIWPLSEDCINCDREPVTTPPIVKPTLYNETLNMSCDGVRNSWYNLGRGRRHHNCSDEARKLCHKKLQINGRKEDQVFLNECAILAANDPDCTDKISTIRGWMTFGNRRTVYCYCQTKLECCNGCSPVKRSGSWKLYTLSRPTN